MADILYTTGEAPLAVSEQPLLEADEQAPIAGELDAQEPAMEDALLEEEIEEELIIEDFSIDGICGVY
ncbi:MAG: mycofactocin precursor MftA [Chloroflexota bacterium]|nr:mycofactocin precursor MftA [Chloroflexota bacterium]